MLKSGGNLVGKIRKNSEKSVHFGEISGPVFLEKFWKNSADFGKIPAKLGPK